MALLAAYSFDESSGDVLDRSGNGHDFPPDPYLSRTTGHTSGGVVGVNQGAAAPIATPAPWGQTTDRTVMCWARMPSGGAASWLVRWQVFSIDSGAWGLVFGSGRIRVQARNAAGSTVVGVTAPLDDSWHHVAAAYRESTGDLLLYLDGALAASGSIAGPLRTDADQLDLLSASNVPLDDLRIYDQALDATAIADAMNTPVGGGGTVTGVIGGQMPALGGQLVGTVTVPGTVGGSMPELGGKLTGAVTDPGVVGGQMPALAGRLTGTAETPEEERAPMLPFVPGMIRAFLLADPAWTAAFPAPRTVTRAPASATTPFALVKAPPAVPVEASAGAWTPLVQVEAYAPAGANPDPEVTAWQGAALAAALLSRARNVPYQNCWWSARVIDGPLPDVDISRGNANPLYRAIIRAELRVHAR